jgi:hypothetical protein
VNGRPGGASGEGPWTIIRQVFLLELQEKGILPETVKKPDPGFVRRL